MADRAGELMGAVMTVLRGDQALAALFPAGRVRVYDIPPTNAPFPYITLSDADDLETPFEGGDSGDVMLMIGCWSRTGPDPSTSQAKAIAAAVRAALALPGALDIMPNNRAGSVIPESLRTLVQPDGQTVQAVLKVEVAVDAVT